MDNRPRSREKRVTNSSSGGVKRRGSGLGTGPVGSGSMFGGSGGGGGNRNGGGGGKRAAGGGGIAIVVAIIFGLIKFLGGGSDTSSATNVSSMYAGASSGNGVQTSYQEIDGSVAAGSREKYTRLAGGGLDEITLLVYMCGTDLESKNGMASSDIAEMTKANLGRTNLLIFTGGCKKWQTSGISANQNQIYKIENGTLKRLEENAGNGAMTNPKTLLSFIKWGVARYPATRYGLIFWDHGGGSVSGYGYDEKNASSGSMSLAGIDSALSSCGVKFDFVGFDACLMATVETALMLNHHADYMIASEETEPGIGWYYTNWLSEIGKNPSLETTKIGKKIADDFVSTCAKKCPGQKTTLSIVDLAEASKTIPSNLSTFANSLRNKIVSEDYRAISDARFRTREFAQSSKIDQIDLVDLCTNVGGNESKALAKAIKGAVKYNKSNLTDSHGLSIYFPYRSARNVDKACETYKKIGLDDSYSKCIREFAGLEVSGQVSQGGSQASLSSLFGALAGSAVQTSQPSSAAIAQLLGSFLSNAGSGLIEGLSSANGSFLSDRTLGAESSASYISKNRLDSSKLVWKKSGKKSTLSLDESQWKLVHELDRAIFYDDGEGYVDLGLDNTFDFDNEGNLIADTDRDWLALNGQVVAYYHISTEEWLDGSKERYTITGRIPAMLNGTRVNLIVLFTDEKPYGFVAGAQSDYKNGETETVAKNMSALKKGDKLDFLCDYYTYAGKYNDTYYLGEPLVVSGDLEVSNVSVGTGKVKIAYRFTDIYNQAYWTQTISN